MSEAAAIEREASGAPVTPVVELARLRFAWLAATPVLDIPHFHVGRGEKLFISGPSGSGKSTLLGLLGGVLKPDAGTVSVLGTDLTLLGAAARDAFRAHHIGFIFQMFNLLPYLSVVENVVLPCRFSDSRRRRATERGDEVHAEAVRLLAHLGLAEGALLERPVTQLSMGQQQRVAAARALIGKPEIVIADEPTSSLDADARAQFLQVLMQECDAVGATVVFVSHDQSLAPFFDRSLALDEINTVRAAEEMGV